MGALLKAALSKGGFMRDPSGVVVTTERGCASTPIISSTNVAKSTRGAATTIFTRATGSNFQPAMEMTMPVGPLPTQTGRLLFAPRAEQEPYVGNKGGHR